MADQRNAVRWPLAPLARRLDAQVARFATRFNESAGWGSVLQKVLDVSPAVASRMVSEGLVSTYHADELAHALGTHPVLVWDGWLEWLIDEDFDWSAAPDDVDDSLIMRRLSDKRSTARRRARVANQRAEESIDGGQDRDERGVA